MNENPQLQVKLARKPCGCLSPPRNHEERAQRRRHAARSVALSRSRHARRVTLSGALVGVRTRDGHLGRRRLPEGRERAGTCPAAAAQPPAPTPPSVSRPAPACLQPDRRHPRRRQVNFKENLPIESLTSKGNVLMVSLPGAFTPT